MDENKILVGMGEFAVAHNPHTLGVIGLGSCIGVALYVKDDHFGGLAHIMLPLSTEFDRTIDNPLKYADLGIAAMFKKMHSMNSWLDASHVTAKIAGGAHMFSGMAVSESMNIGKRNAIAVKDTLKSLGIRLVAEDTGANHGRTINFDLTTGEVSVCTQLREIKII